VKQIRVQSQETYNREAINNTQEEDMLGGEDDLDMFERAQEYMQKQEESQCKYAMTDINKERCVVEPSIFYHKPTQKESQNRYTKKEKSHQYKTHHEVE
jgi:hypothetical protein